MSRSQSSPDAIEKLFIKSVLTKVCSDNEQATYSSIEILQNKLIGNAVSVRSPLDGGLSGHLFLVVSDEDYRKAIVGNLAKPVVPVKPTPPTLVIPVEQGVLRQLQLCIIFIVKSLVFIAKI